MKKKLYGTPEENTSITEHILASLKYLHYNCPSAELKPLFKVSLDLCSSVITFNPQEKNKRGTPDNGLEAKNFISSLEYLRNEASRHELVEIKMILDTTFMLCIAVYSLQLKKRYYSAEFISIA